MIDRRRALAALVGGAAALALTGCHPKPASRGVVFALQKSALPLVARERGDFQRRLAARGVAPVTWAQFPSGAPLIEALRAGALDIGLVGDTPVVYAQAAGADIYYVAAQRYPGPVGSGLLVPAESTVTSLAELKGRRIAYAKGSAAEYLLAAGLRTIGLTLKDVEVVNLQPGEAQSALASGSVDGWVIWDPYLAAAELAGARGVPLPPPGTASNGFYVASGSFVRDRPDALRATLDELRAEAAWGDANPGYYRDLLERTTHLPPNVVDRMLSRYGGKLFQVDPITQDVIANQQKVSDALFADGVIPKKVDAAQAAWTGWKRKT
jgi:sulfonate transport system substrate-binding protein